jgi:hypothetical protein
MSSTEKGLLHSKTIITGSLDISFYKFSFSLDQLIHSNNIKWKHGSTVIFKYVRVAVWVWVWVWVFCLSVRMSVSIFIVLTNNKKKKKNLQLELFVCKPGIIIQQKRVAMIIIGVLCH